MLEVVKLTAPVNPFTDTTASVLSTFSHSVPWYITQSPTCQSVMPSKLVVPATDTI